MSTKRILIQVRYIKRMTFGNTNFCQLQSTVINIVCCVGRVEIQIEIKKGRCTANTDSIYSIV